MKKRIAPDADIARPSRAAQERGALDVRSLETSASVAPTTHVVGMPDADMPSARAMFAASPVTERNVTQGVDWNGVYRDRYSYQRSTVLAETLLAWRMNPMARSIVELSQQYTIDGIAFECNHRPTMRFLESFWNHDLNQVQELLPAWADEYCLTGNAFPLLTTDEAGMSYLRLHPTDLIEEIRTRRNDIAQETSYVPKPTQENPNPAPWSSYYAAPRRKHVMLHSAVNRLAGMKWGEPDLAPLLPWLARYAAWLEDRVRLNRYRNAFMYVYKRNFLSGAEKEAARQLFAANPPTPGSILVTDINESWDVMSPKLDSGDANTDGLALKKFILGGRLPLHYLAEPESSTRTTADAAGTPTFKRFERRQQFFRARVKEILTIVVKRRRMWGDDTLDPRAEIRVTAADITEKDNAALALATSQIVQSMKSLVEEGYITPEEFLRFVYRFAGEPIPSSRGDGVQPSPEAPLPRGSGKGTRRAAGVGPAAEVPRPRGRGTRGGTNVGIGVDLETGDAETAD